MEALFPPIIREIILLGIIPSLGGQFSVWIGGMDIPLCVYSGAYDLLLLSLGCFAYGSQTGTILLIALPLGAVLCFCDLLGARAFSRGELALQSRFHGPLAHALPYPPRPIFTRYRPLTPAEIESGHAIAARSILVAERSFYKNTYAMVRASFS